MAILTHNLDRMSPSFAGKVAIIVPARLDSVRLPRKVLAQIGEKKLIEWVLGQALAANCADVFLAYSDEEIVEQSFLEGVRTIKTDPTLANGTMRVHAASLELPASYEYIINLQGDMPFIEPEILQQTATALINSNNSDIITPVCVITDQADITPPSIVKVAMTQTQRALYFSRSPIPYGAEVYYKHIGVYGFRRDILNLFMALPPSTLERSENLEQLRAIEHGLGIQCVIVDSFPLSVDVPDDLKKARECVINA